MKTFEQFEAHMSSVPQTVAWSLASLGEALGRQQLFTRQSPQRLQRLRESAIIESAISSNRIEGVDVEKERIATVIYGKSLLRDRDEEEVRGYRDALKLIHENGREMKLSVDLIRELHHLSRAGIGDAGQFKLEKSDIIEKYPDGRTRVRFSTVGPEQVDEYVTRLVCLWDRCLAERWIHPLIALCAFNLDFLCIHPFRDGNGRVSRLLFLLQSYQLGYEVGRYVSLEKAIEENKERYYETLETSSIGWHEGSHDPWHLTNYLMFILKSSYATFEQRAASFQSPRGEKTAMIEAVIHALPDEFRIAEIEKDVDASPDMIRKVLRDLKKDGLLEIISMGRNALWRKLGNKK